MDRLLSALVLGVYLVSCAPVLLPPAGSAEAGGRPDGCGAGRALSAGQAAAKGELPDIAREKRLVEAWQRNIMQQDEELRRALREQIPEMIRRYDGLHPASGFDPQSVWKKPPHTYVYQVNRGSVRVRNEFYYDVRQVGFLFNKVEEAERAETAYVGKAELLLPYFMQCFGEVAIQRAAGNSDPNFADYPLVKAILDKGLKPADYVGYTAYYWLYREERVGPPRKDDTTLSYYYGVTLPKYREEITLEHRDYCKQYELYAADEALPLEPGEERLDREYIAGQGIDFSSEDFEERLNGYSVRKSAFENVGDIIDGYWEGLQDTPAFRRAFELAVEGIGAYLDSADVAAVCLPTYFKLRHTFPVYRCRAPYLAVCGAAQALSLGWVQVPVVAVHLEGDSSYIDVPRITSADSNQIGISYASFETGRGHGQEGFSGRSSKGAPSLDDHSGQPDRFAMGAFSTGQSVFHVPKGSTQPADVFAEVYLQCNYPYKEFSREALSGMSESEVAKTVLKTCTDSVPRYWRDRFHRDYDDRNTGKDIVNLYLLAVFVLTIGAEIAYWYQFYQLASAAAAGGAALEATSDIAAGWAALEAAGSAEPLIQPAYLIFVGTVDKTVASMPNYLGGPGYVPYASPALAGTTNQYGWLYWRFADNIYLVPPWITNELYPLGTLQLQALYKGQYAVLLDTAGPAVFHLNIVGTAPRMIAPRIWAHMQMAVWGVLRPAYLLPRVPPFMFMW